ncbi:hypothetical protein CDD80_3716 [Ophiocordyceps camponoti-rufipedis]|uniref:RING-type domain-containing protein n=1 Tax=Ophiocordyceps camponoti-rufipedis TaxID=2004952 RepID=A0A2C5YVL0_9HYPO|nr:hypothetical protein CDD80_3716 [Ophiocordyceps camponoti-rufipedis]
MATAATLAEQPFDSPAELLLADQLPGSAEWEDVWSAGLPPLPPPSQRFQRVSSPRQTPAADHPSSSSKFSPPARAHDFSSPWRLNPDFDLDNQWNFDSVDGTSLASRSTQSTSFLEDGAYLSFLADNSFSSPSDYPSFLERRPETGISLHDSSTSASAAVPRSPSLTDNHAFYLDDDFFASSSQLANELNSSSTINTLPNYHFGDQTLSRDFASGSLAEMPPTRTRSSVDDDANHASAPSPKRQRTSFTQGCHSSMKPMAMPKPSDDDDDDPFVDKIKKDPNDLPTIDLTGNEAITEEAEKQEPDRRIKISAYQCAICMDNVTTLMVTHCGHLYCQECLHSSLHVDSTKGKCPMCRAKIDMKHRSTYTTKTKGFWPLELKFMTVDKKGKRKANAMS